MDNLEEVSRKRARRGQIESVVLGSLAFVGVAAITIAAPNMLKLLKHVDPRWIGKRDHRYPCGLHIFPARDSSPHSNFSSGLR